MARRLALAVALVAVLMLPVSGAGGADAQTPKRGGTLVMATADFLEPACLNPLLQVCRPAVATVRAEDVVLSGAFEVTPDDTFRGDLVSGARIVAKEPFTLLYRIRPEARWSDGVPVSAQDFVFTHQAFRKHAPTADESDRIRSVRRIDEKTFRVVLRERYVDWRYLFSIVLPNHVLAGEDLATVWRNRIDNPQTGRAIGSGPFVVGGWERGRQLTFVRNSRYRGRHSAHLDRLAYRFLPPDETADALRRGEVDMIQPGPAVLQSEHTKLRRQPEPGIRVVPVPADGWEHLTIRVGEGGHPALEDPRVRQALAFGIDRVAIARAIGELSYQPASTVGPQDSMIFFRGSPHYRPIWSGYRHRADRARQLLGQAGCRRGSDGIFVCGSGPLSLRLATVAGTERRELTVRLVQEQLRRVGIEVQLEFAQAGVFFGRIVPNGAFDVVSFAWFTGASTGGPGVSLQCQRDENWSGYCDRLLTRDLDRAARTLDLDRRLKLLNGIDARLAKTVPHIPLYPVSGLWALSATVRGVVQNRAGHFTWNAEDWWLAD